MTAASNRPWPQRIEWSEATTGEQWQLRLEQARKPSTQQFCWRCKGLCDRDKGRAGMKCGRQANYFGTHLRSRLEDARKPADDSYVRSHDDRAVPTSIWLCWCCVVQLVGTEQMPVQEQDTEDQGMLGLLPSRAPEPTEPPAEGSNGQQEPSGPSFAELMNDLNRTIDRLDRANADGDVDMARHWRQRRSEIEEQMLAAHR